MSEGADVTLDTAVLADLAAKHTHDFWPTDKCSFDGQKCPCDAAVLLAEVESLRKVGRKVIDVEEAYRAALNGGGHPGEPHDRALHFGPVLPGGIEVFDEVGDCSNCGGQQYGTEDDQQQAIAELRIALGIPLRPFEDFRAALVSRKGAAE